MNWYEMVVSDHMGPSPSPYLNDYASPDEIKLAVDGLKRLRRKLHREGLKVERRAVMDLLDRFHVGMIDAGYGCSQKQLDQMDHLLPPVVLTILSRSAQAEQWVGTVRYRYTDDAAWEAELRRRRLAEEA
jgi:hypothetical protein